MSPATNLKPFQKGVSGNPGGRPSIPNEVKEAAKTHTQEAIKTLVKVMKDVKAPASARISAAQAILDRAWGKPLQSVDVVQRVKSHEEWLEELK